MADDKSSEQPAPATAVEAIPSIAGGVSAIASASAPFIYFDNAPNYGVNSGVVNVTLEAARYTPVGGKVVFDRVIVAHLRMSLPAAESLRNSIDAALAMVAPPTKKEEVN